jgi:serine protease AprX
MKRLVFLYLMLSAVVFSGCQPAVQNSDIAATQLVGETAIVPTLLQRTATITDEPEQATEMLPTNTAQPTRSPTKPPVKATQTARTDQSDVSSLEMYQNVRDLKLSAYKGTLDRAMIESFWFNLNTKWPDEFSDLAQEVIESGKNPGLGIRDLHSAGITGEGVTVAIIDQNLLLDHPEISGKILSYFDTGTEQPENEGSMHAPAVTSLLVGETTGTAPGAKVYFAAVPSWLRDSQYYADALNWLVDENEKLPEREKIRVVSLSAAPAGAISPSLHNQEAWTAAYHRATDAGILVLDCTTEYGVTAACTLDLDDPDNPEKCIPGYPGVEVELNSAQIYIPSSKRTMAEEYKKSDYGFQFTGRGGLSWTVPYLAGVLALGWQIQPDLSPDQMLELIFETAYVTNDGLKIINPPAFIERVKQE